MHNLPFPLLAETVGERFAGAGMTVLIGLVVVFSVLILLTFIFFLFGKVVGRSKPPRSRPRPLKKLSRLSSRPPFPGPFRPLWWKTASARRLSP